MIFKWYLNDLVKKSIIQDLNGLFKEKVYIPIMPLKRLIKINWKIDESFKNFWLLYDRLYVNARNKRWTFWKELFEWRLLHFFGQIFIRINVKTITKESKKAYNII